MSLEKKSIAGWLPRAGALVLIVALAGCTAPDVMRAVLGGVNSDQARLNKANVQNGNSFPAAP